MGIQNFHQFMKKKAPNVYKTVSFSNYTGQPIAVDVSGLIFKFKVLNPSKWLDSFSYLILAFRRNKIHPIFVFDGCAPVDKDDEKSRRNQQRQNAVEKLYNLRESLDNYYSTGEASEILIETMNKLNTNAPPSLTQNVKINSNLIEQKYEQLESQIVKMSHQDMEDLRNLFNLFGVQYTTSQGEAETLCASLAIDGKVAGVVTNDSDICAYGVKKFLYEVNGMNETFTEIDYDEILKTLELTSSEFLDFCIMCGCDYNKNIPKVGPVGAYNLIKQYKSIDNISNLYDISILNHTRARELFTQKFDFEDDIISKVLCYNEIVQLYNFLTLKNSRIKLKTIEDAFKEVEIILQEN